ncbi:MAG TPA: MFS transporter [Acidimicrobiales bacterium]|nr:MFS transporter [Acidimicrobiales bacterium]
MVLSWVSLFQDTASELLYPILPIFLTSVLGAPVAVVGIIEGLADGVASVTKLFSGRLADRRGRKGLVAWGYGLAAAAKVLIAVATVWPLVLAARVVDRFGKGMRGAPRDALIADMTAPEHRGRAFGFHRSVDTFGAVLGPLIGLGLYQALDHQIRPLLVIAAVPAILSVALVAFVRETRPTPGLAGPDKAPVIGTGPLPRPYWRVVIVLTMFSVVNFSDALLLLRARHLGLSVAGVIGVYALYNLTYALLSYPAGALSDRLPRRVVVAAGLAIFAVAYIGLGVTRSTVAPWVLFPIYGCYAALTEGVTKAWLIDLVPGDARGRALGNQQGLAGGGAIIAGIWAGLLWNSTGTVPLVAAGIIAAGLAVVLVGAGRRLEHEVPVTP